MSTDASVYTTVEGLPNPSLPKHLVNPDYASIKEAHQLLTANAALVKISLGRWQNGYLGVIPPPRKYACITSTPFVCLPNPLIMATVPPCMSTREKKSILLEHK